MNLAAAVAQWAPPAVETTEQITAGPADALAGLLDTAAPAAQLPPAWHWVYLLGRPAQRDLGPDGHPRGGPFTPPVPGRHRMYAGARLHLHRPLCIGDVVTRRSELVRVAVKAGRRGQLLFITTRDRLTAGGAVLVEEERDIVYRTDERPSPPPPRAAPPAPLAPWTTRITPHETLLFRFSALTYNAHRIHYDRAYATGVEGYPDLLVQGPLIALLLLELPRRNGYRVCQLSVRAHAPAHPGRPLLLGGSPQGLLRAVGADGGTVMSGRFSAVPPAAGPTEAE